MEIGGSLKEIGGYLKEIGYVGMEGWISKEWSGCVERAYGRGKAGGKEGTERGL